MKLISTVSWSALATLIRLSAGFVSMKFVALLVGPYGVALVGQFGNFTQIIMTLALGGIGSGIVKYTSQFNQNQPELHKIWCTSIWISGIMIIPLVLFILFFHGWLSQLIFNDKKYGSVFIVFACVLVFYVANNLLLNILNGLHEIKKFSILNTLNSLLGLGVTVLLVYVYNIFGALLAIAISQSITFFIMVLFVVRSHWFKFSAFFGKFYKEYFNKLMAFTGMSLVSICVIPTSQMFVRSYLANKTSWQIAGCWQGMQKISDSYLMIVYTALGTYYLPKLANLQDSKQIGYEISRGYKVIMPFVIGSAVIIYLFRDIIINLLFAKTFIPMRDMFLWQLTGDCFKIASFLLAYLMLAKAKTRLYVLTEIIFGFSFTLMSYLLINLVGANGGVIAFAANYFVYFILFIILYKKRYLIT